MEEIVKTVLLSMSSINQPQRAFFQSLFLVFMSFQGKATIRNLARYCEMSEKRFSRWYKRTFDFPLFNRLLLKYTLSNDRESIATVDCCFLKKSGKKTQGLGWFYNGSAGENQKGLEISLVSTIDIQANTGYAIEAKQTLSQKEETRVDGYARQVTALAEALKTDGIRHLAVDSYYWKKKFVSPVFDSGLDLVGKLRCDANLRWLHQADKAIKKGPGRPKDYDGKVDVERDLDRFEYIDELEPFVYVYTAIVNSPRMGINIRLVMLVNCCPGHYSRVLLYSTDLNLCPLKVIQYYKARFQIEFIFRDAKQHTGLADCQSLLAERRYTHLNASLTALNLLKLEDRLDKKTHSETVISIASWKRRKFNEELLKRIFSNLGLTLRCDKIRKLYAECRQFGVIAA